MSRRASQAGIDAIRQAMKRNGWTQAEVAKEVGFARSTLNQILGGQAVKLENLEELCHLFDLQIGQIVEPESLANLSNLDSLVQTIRDRIRPLIQEKCGTMRVLDMSQPIALGEIYTHVNILEKITGRKRRELADLIRDVSPENFERFSLGAVKETIPGLEAVDKHSKLMILGKPGAGKTTFLKHLAIQCIGGTFQSDRVPFFITLKEFAEADGKPDLMTFCDQAIATSLPSPNTQQILDNGRALILLDGLDEVRETDASRVLRQIQKFSEQYHSNTFVITCRIAVRECPFQQFTEVEVADFDDDQIADFADKWFRSRKESVRTEDFLQKLNDKTPIRKLATSPLLLSLLCLIFEDSGDFPAKRSSIYEQGIDQLLREWNPYERERCLFYKELSPDYRQSLLRYIAAKTFEKGNYFFKQQEVGKLIKEYIEGLGCFTSRELLKLDSQVTLKTIEAQHGLLIERASGVYSFSHLTFHEYFAALEITETPSFESLQRLAAHITQERWREVFLLSVGMADPADELLRLMKHYTDELLAEENKLQKFLRWVDEKARPPNAIYQPVSVREFYFGLPICIGLDYHYDYYDNNTLGKALSLDRALEFALDRACACMSALDEGFDPDRDTLDLDFARDETLDLAYIQDPSLYIPLKHIVDQLPEQSRENRRNFNQWWKANGKAWTLQLQTTILNKRNIGHDWQFSVAQQEKLQQYYDANQLLLDCLNSACYVSREVRQEIEETLLLPMTEIEQRMLSKR